MKIARRFTEAGQDVYEAIEWTTRSCKIANLDGTTVFEMNDVEVPKSWSQLATDIMVSKYFRKAGVPQPAEGKDPIKAIAKGDLERGDDGKPVTGPERSVRQVVNRLAGCWRHWGETHGYFDTTEDAQAFYDELAHMMLRQMAAPNSPQWFNTGLSWAYGITGPAQGHWITDPKTKETKLADDAYSHPQPHACFIQSVDDDLVNEGGIMDLWVREARLFKYGSGTGTNFSKLRAESESLSGGGKSSGLMSWLKIGDRAAGAIKSGGTTRRAAKMVCLDLDHPDIESFINWKVREELKVAALVEGVKHLKPEQREAAKALGLELNYDFNGESYLTVSGQNSNNSVRIGNEFFHRLDSNEDWQLFRRTDGEVAKTLPARELWGQVADAAWHCADPGVQFDTTINQWHTCPASGRINASNPCSEYMFLDNTACNLASLNLLKFFDHGSCSFKLDDFEHATRLWTIVLEISVLMASFPSKNIARLSYEFRTLGLGHANVGAMLMQAGVPYDSEEGRAICGAVTAVLTGRSYATSAEMAEQLGPFQGYFANRDHMLRVIRNHRRAAYGVPRDEDVAQAHELGGYEGLELTPVPLNTELLESPSAIARTLSNSEELSLRARAAWDEAAELGNHHGFRNAQATVIAPTGTIGLLMDCDTTGLEPDFALVKFKKLAGGGYFKIANQSLRPALVALGYDTEQVRDIMCYVMGTLDVDVPVPGGEAGETLLGMLKERGLIDEDLRKITDALPTVFELSHAFSAWTLGEEAVARLGLSEAELAGVGGDVLRALGLDKAQIADLSRVICGTQTVEGAPHLLREHLAVFDCANPPSAGGLGGQRYIAPQGHIRMMAAAQPFISGAISKTINLPNSASVDDIKAAYRLSWELGLKANALYRDGCKLSQPLNVKGDEDDGVEDEEGIEMGKEEVGAEVASVAARIASAGIEGESVVERLEQEGVRVQTVEKIVERIVERPLRRRLPDTRSSMTHKFNVAGHEGYLTVGLYQDGSPGELFITMAKEGSTIGGLMDSLGTAISVALQYGVPVESLVDKFTHQRFEPAGMTHNRDIPFAKSLVDYIFRWLGMQFIPGYRSANAPQRQSESTDTAKKSGPAVVVTAKAGKAADGLTNQNQADVPINKDSDAGAAGGREREVTEVRSEAVNVQWSEQREETSSAGKATIVLSTAMTQMQTDAPACDVCGTITVRNGTCYKCLNCGNSMGCS